jgi:hypothetical protein
MKAMNPSDLLRLAGDASEMLETMGFTSVARLRDEVVTLTAWRVVGGRQLTHVHVVDGSLVSSRVLAQTCAVEFRVQHGLMQGM